MAGRNLPRIVAQLLAHGCSPDTPVALIRWGTTERQETVTGRLADIVAPAAGLQPPVVTLIGEVVRLRDRLRWFEDLATFYRHERHIAAPSTPYPDVTAEGVSVN